MGRGSGVRAVGKEAIQVDFRWKGIRCRERIRLPPTDGNLKYVKRLKAVIEHEIATGTFEYSRHFPESERAKAVTGGATLRAAMTAYIDSLVGSVEPETLYEYRNDAEVFASWFPADKALASLTRAEVRTELAKQNLSRSRLNSLLKPIRGTLRQLVEDCPTMRNPLQNFQIRRVEPEKDDLIDPFTPQEIERLSATEHGRLWKFVAWTGIRTGELIGLRRGDVDLDTQSLNIRRTIRRGRVKVPKTKAGKRCIDLLPEARAVLGHGFDPHRDAETPLFPHPATGTDWKHANTINKAFRRACQAANVRYRYPYQLRHTFATWALSCGENPLWVAKMLGHKDVTILYRHYAKWMQDLDAMAGRRMAALVQKAQTRAA